MKSISLLFALTLFFITGFTQQGTLDVNFGDSGKVVSTNYEGEIRTSIIQPDGKILVGGIGSYGTDNSLLYGSLLARYNTTGTLDLSFADSGRGIYILGDTGTFIPTIQSMVLQSDGKILAIGSPAQQRGDFGFCLMRFNQDGSADNTFGIGGMLLSNFTGADVPTDITLLSDGKIVVTGLAFSQENEDEKCFLSCYNSDGSLNKNFGNEGVVIIDLGFSSRIYSIASTADNKILLGGINDDDVRGILLRYNANGSPDFSFGTNGLTQMQIDSRSYSGQIIKDISIADDGSILAGGDLYLNSGKLTVTASRFSTDGKPDSSFGTNGYTHTEYPDGDADGTSIAVQKDGKIIVGGNFNNHITRSFTILRYNQIGLLDSSFGISGIQNTYFSGTDFGTSVKIQSDNKIVLAGYSQRLNSGDQDHVDIARYNNNPTQKQVLIAKIRHWIQHHNGIEWDYNNNISSYVVQRSYDGIHFSSIARINSSNSSNLTYQDQSPLNGTNYYRLQTTSLNGTVNYSNVIAITNSDIKIAPNPATNSLHIEGLSNQKVQLSVVDFSGNVKLQTTVHSSTYNLSISSLKPGNYLLKIQSQDDVVTKSFVKE